MRIGAAVLSLALASYGCALGSAQEQPRLVTGIDWVGRGTWLRAEFHTHTQFSDGSYLVEDVVANAKRFGCDVVAINDHGDAGLRGGTPEYTDAIKVARQNHPDMVVITGMEWNVPPGKGQEHATVLFPTAMESSAVLMPFREQFDDNDKEGENPELALKGLAALTPRAPGAVAPVMFFNHPSRRPGSTSTPMLTLAALKKQAPRIVIGVEGAPGHQKSRPLGSYGDQARLIDRWDKVVAEPGGVWDQWLKDGLSVWGAIASADLHNVSGEYWPCEFSSTWVYAPERSPDGVIRALRAGSFFAEQGGIVSEVDLVARFGESGRGFHPGETVAVRAGAVATVSLQLTPTKVDYAGKDSRIDTVELFGISTKGVETLFSGAPAVATAFSVPVTVPAGGIVLRARGRRALDDGSGLVFYTNPIRINVR